MTNISKGPKYRMTWGREFTALGHQNEYGVSLRVSFGASLVAQWLRVCLLMQGTRVRAQGSPEGHSKMGNWARESLDSLSKIIDLKCKACTGKDTGQALEPMLWTPLHILSPPMGAGFQSLDQLILQPLTLHGWECPFSGRVWEKHRDHGKDCPLIREHEVPCPYHHICNLCVCVCVCVCVCDFRVWTKVNERKLESKTTPFTSGSP